MAFVDLARVNLDPRTLLSNDSIEWLAPRARQDDGDPAVIYQPNVDSDAAFAGLHGLTRPDVVEFQINVRLGWIDDKLVSEGGVNAGIAGYFGVPVGAVSGDDKITKELTSLLGNIETAVVKEGIERFVANCLPLQESRERIKNAAKKAIERRKEFKPLKYTSPTTFKVRFASTTQAETACMLPIVKMVDPRTISVQQDDYLDAFRTFHAVISLASTAQDPIFG